MEKTLKVSNKQQIARLIELVAKTPKICRGIRSFGCNRNEINTTWARFAVELNDLGPPARTGAEWHRVWIHYKANLKRKIVKQRQSLLETGGDSAPEVALSASEMRVYELMQKKYSSDEKGRSPISDASDSEMEFSHMATETNTTEIQSLKSNLETKADDIMNTASSLLNNMGKTVRNDIFLSHLKEEMEDLEGEVLRETKWSILDVVRAAQIKQRQQRHQPPNLNT